MPRVVLPTSTVAILRRTLTGNTLGNSADAVTFRALDCGVDAADDGSLVELRLTCGEIDAFLRCVSSAVYEWELGNLDGGDEVYKALEAARETLNAALDEAHEGELDGLAAARDHDRAYGDDTPSYDSWQRNDAGEYLGVH